MIERWFMELKNRTKRFYNKVNAKTLKCLEELATAIVTMHNINKGRRGEVILAWQYHFRIKIITATNAERNNKQQYG
jgi:hypothetical protein